MPKIVDHEERRRAIAKAAIAVIAKKGLDSTKLVDIGKHAGVTTGAVTHYFNDKDAVLIAALTIAYENLFDDIDVQLGQSPSSLFEHLRVALPIKKNSRETMSVWLEFWGKSISQPAIAARQLQFHQEWQEKVQEMVHTHCTNHGRSLPQDMDDFCESITAYLNGLILRGLVDPANWPKERLEKLLFDFLKRINLD